MNKLYFSIIISILLLSSFVLGVSPILQQSKNTGLEITTNVVGNFKINGNHEFDIHVFNSSSGHLITSGIGCYLHIYYDSIGHVYEGFNGSIGLEDDYILSPDQAVFNKTGDYGFLTFCNSSTIGGYETGSFQVTPTSDGFANGNFYLLIWLLIIISLSLFIFLTLYSIGHLLNYDFDIKDLGFNYTALFLLYLTNYLVNNYIQDLFSQNLISTFLTLSIYINGFVATIIFIVSLIVGSLKKKKVQVGDVYGY